MTNRIELDVSINGIPSVNVGAMTTTDGTCSSWEIFKTSMQEECPVNWFRAIPWLDPTI